MTLKPKRVAASAIALIMALAMIAGCAGGGNNSSPGSGDSGTPVEGGILRFGTSSIDGVFNPIMTDQIYDNYVCALIFDGLITNDHSGAITASNMCSLTISDDHLTYTFKLTKDVKFTDGTAMTANDIAFTYKTIGHPDYNGPRDYAVMDMVGYEEYKSGAADDFEGIKVIDEKTVSFTFQDGTASPANIECFSYGILPEHYYKFDDFNDFIELNEKPLGSNFFVLEEFKPLEYTKLARNDNYWDEANKPHIEGILISNIAEENLMDAFATGQLDLAQPGASQETYDEYLKMDGVTIKSQLGNGYTFLCFNTRRPQLEDVRVRQALMYALDRASFIEAQYGKDLGSVGLAPISPLSWAFPSDGINDYAFDMAKAEQLMKDAGWEKGSDGILQKDGIRMSVSWLVYTDSAWPGLLSSMAADTWKQLGVELNIEIMDFNTVSARTMEDPSEDKNFDIYTMGFSLSIDPDASGGLFDYNAFPIGFNASGFYNERSQQLISEGKTEFDQAKRAIIYKEWAQLMNELIPTVIVAYRNELWVNSNRVKNLDISSYCDWTYFINKLWIDG